MPLTKAFHNQPTSRAHTSVFYSIFFLALSEILIYLLARVLSSLLNYKLHDNRNLVCLGSLAPSTSAWHIWALKNIAGGMNEGMKPNGIPERCGQ